MRSRRHPAPVINRSKPYSLTKTASLRAYIQSGKAVHIRKSSLICTGSLHARHFVFGSDRATNEREMLYTGHHASAAHQHHHTRVQKRHGCSKRFEAAEDSIMHLYRHKQVVIRIITTTAGASINIDFNRCQVLQMF